MKFQSMFAVAAAILVSTAATHAASPANSSMVLAAPDKPGRPDLTIVNQNFVTIEWADNSDNERGFHIQREKRTGGVWGGTTTIATVDANVDRWTAGAYRGKYRFRVRAWNNQGNSAWSRWRSVNTRRAPILRDENGTTNESTD